MPWTDEAGKFVKTVPLYNIELQKQVISEIFPELAEFGFSDSRVSLACEETVPLLTCTALLVHRQSRQQFCYRLCSRIRRELIRMHGWIVGDKKSFKSCSDTNILQWTWFQVPSNPRQGK